MGKPLSSFGQAFVSYGSYHFDPINQWIHIFCVPVIAATLICAISYIPYSITFQGYTLGVETLLVGIALAYYASINLIFAFSMFVLMLLMTLGWRFAFEGMEEQKFFYWVIGIHIVAWILQFVGHGIFEKRKPALLDNLTQILNAPLFVVVEILGKLGYESQETKYWLGLIEKRVMQFRESTKASKTQ